MFGYRLETRKIKWNWFNRQKSEIEVRPKKNVETIRCKLKADFFPAPFRLLPSRWFFPMFDYLSDDTFFSVISSRRVIEIDL